MSSKDTPRTPAQKALSIEEFVAGLDVELLEYVPDLRRLGFTSSTAVKFLKLSDFEAFSTKVSIGHRRMLLNAAEKLRTPSSKLGVSPDVGITVGFGNAAAAHKTGKVSSYHNYAAPPPLFIP